MSGRPVEANKCKVNHNNFLNINDPIYSYILGLLWTDGHINKNNNTIVFTSTEPDGQYFSKCFLKTGNWNQYIYHYKNNWKSRYTIQTTNKYFKDFLVQYNFTKKEEGIDLIYHYIPQQYQKYFIIGLIDGDGTIYYNKIKGLYSLSLCSSYTQNWDCLITYLNHINIKYKLEQRLTKRGNYSKIHIFGKSRVTRFCDCIYSDYLFGLPRKYEKYLIIKSLCNKWIMRDAQ